MYTAVRLFKLGEWITLKEGGKRYQIIAHEGTDHTGKTGVLLQVEGTSKRIYAVAPTKQVYGVPDPSSDAPAPKPALGSKRSHDIEGEIVTIDETDVEELTEEEMHRAITGAIKTINSLLPEGAIDPEVDETLRAKLKSATTASPVFLKDANLRVGDRFVATTTPVEFTVTKRSGFVITVEAGGRTETLDTAVDLSPIRVTHRAAKASAPEPTVETKAPAPTKPETSKGASGVSVLDYLKDQNVSKYMIELINTHRTTHGVSMKNPDYPKLRSFYFGGDQLRLTLAALLSGNHVILKGPKGSGKNTLAETAAYLLATPLTEIQGHAHLDADSIIGHEVFKSTPRDVQDMLDMASHLKSKGLSEGQITGILSSQGKKDEVTYLYGTVALAAQEGKFAVLDEANSVRPEALIVTHSLRDDRRRLDIPGYGVVTAHPRFRMIITMNPGYAGTSEMNEATADGFVPIYVPPMDAVNFAKLIARRYEEYGIKGNAPSLLSGLFHDLLKKSGATGGAAEISSRPVSVRAVFQALDLVRMGIKPRDAVLTSFVERTDDDFEKKTVGDVIKTRIPDGWGPNEWFKGVVEL